MAAGPTSTAGPTALGLIGQILDRLTDWVVALLSAAGGFIARAMDGIVNTAALNAVGTFVARVMDEGIDTVVLGLWHTLFGQRKKRDGVTVGNHFTYALGRLFDRIARLLNRTVRRKRPIETSFVAVFAAGWEELRADFRRLSWSVSFGLLLLCVGLYIVFAYLLM